MASAAHSLASPNGGSSNGSVSGASSGAASSYNRAPSDGSSVGNTRSQSLGGENNENEQQESTAVVPLSYNTKVRHGFNSISEEWLSQLAEGYYDYFADKRHEKRKPVSEKDSVDGGDWRVTDRQRTVNAALVLCLNIGVDPPDIIKTQPAARLEAWVDPQQFVDSKKALEQIGKNLQAQYESLSTRTKYKQSLDPNSDDIKRFCVSLRRSARDDRILFHYNGHGVPRPTPSGEIWVFNRGYTQYIPLSVYELQSWLGAPVIYCWDCSGAGNLVRSFDDFVEKRKAHHTDDEPAYKYDTCIQLGSCRADEILPMNPKLPADLFTCCITTPVDIAVKWFLLQNSGGFTAAGLDPTTVQIPGRITDRRTPLGELNWIFTAITDTIAWSALEPKLFKRLFRQDLIVAAMFRNFLLASRIMRAHNCHPVSSPALPDTYDHPLWDSWDAAVNHCLLQIAAPSPQIDGRLFSDFFEQQLTAFEMWLTYRSGNVSDPPEQLPILLQVLLSQIHRLRALTLLCRYLDLGPEAVRIALSIGFFIYVLKLLQSPAPELRPVLVFIWARIMAVDQRVQTELVKEQGYSYFVNILIGYDSSSQNDANDRAMCCFVLAQFTHGYQSAQRILAGNEELVVSLETCLDAESPLLRQWAILFLAELSPKRSLSRLLWRLRDPIPEVRAATLYCLGEYFSSGQLNDSLVDQVGKAMVSVALDGSPIVRHQFVVCLSYFVLLNIAKFLVCAFTTLEEEFAASKYGGDMRSQSPAHGTVSLALWRCLLVLTDDAMPSVKLAAEKLVDTVQSQLMSTPLGDDVSQMANVLLEPSELRKISEPRTQPVSDAIAAQAKQLHERTSATGSLLRSAFNWVVGSDQQPKSLRQQSSRVNLRPLETPPDSPPSKPSAPLMNPTEWHFEQASDGTAAQAKVSKLPLTTDFRELCVEFFREPQLTPPDADEPGSTRYFERHWKKTRNEKILAETQVQKSLAVSGTWNSQVSSLDSRAAPPKKLVFAQYESQILAATENEVTVFDWHKSKLLNRFNGGRQVSDIRLINEDDSPLALTASRDGIARVFRNYESPESVQIVTSWWLFADLVHHQPHNPSVVIDWQQSRGALLVGGDARVIRVWDAAREQTASDVPLRTSAQLTSLSSDQVTGNFVLAGFSDGAVHVYDRRLDKQEALVKRWKPMSNGLHSNKQGHKSRIINVRMQRGGPREAVSGSVDGAVCLWDIRSSAPVGYFKAHSNEMRCFDLHEHAPVIGTASRVAGIWTTSGRRVSTIKIPSSSYSPSKVPPVGALVFHPHRMLLATSNVEESNISIFRCVP